MRNRLKKNITLFMALLVCFTSIPIPVWAGGYETAIHEKGELKDEVQNFDLEGYKYVVSFSDEGSMSSTISKVAAEAGEQGTVYGIDGEFDGRGEIKMQEAAAIANRFYFTTKHNASGSRIVKSDKDWGDALSIFADKSALDEFGLSKMPGTNNSNFKRQHAFLFVAAAAIGYNKDNGVKEAYSGTELGKYANGTTIKNADGCYKASEAIGMSEDQIMAANILFDNDHLSGKQGGYLAPDDPCLRYEWVLMLYNINTDIGDPAYIAKTINKGNNDGGGNKDDDDDDDPTPPPEDDEEEEEEPSEISAGLSISVDDYDVNYKDWANGKKVTADIDLNASASDSNYRIKKYEYEASSPAATGDDSDSSSSSSTTLELDFTSASLDSAGVEEGSYSAANIGVRGEVEVTDSYPESDTASDSTSFKLRLTNEKPKAGFTIKTDSITSTAYAQRFFYVGKPVTFTDSATDPENDWQAKQLLIRKDGTLTGVVQNFVDDHTDVDFNSNFSAFAGTSATSASMTFAKAGTYELEYIVYDAWGEKDSIKKTITVTEAPAPPDAIIRTSSDFIFKGAKISVFDASTDPNNDIVNWTWGKVMVHDTDANGEPLSTTKQATGYSGTLANKELSTQPTVNPGGTLTFPGLGTYDVSLNVKDATGLKDSTTKSFEVIDNVPVLDINPKPGDDYDGNPGVTPPFWKDETGEKTDPQDPHWGTGVIPQPGLDYEGNPGDEVLFVKEDRLVILDTSQSLEPSTSVIIDEDTEWKFETITGASPEFVKDFCTDRKKGFIIKDPGLVRLTVTLHNEYSDNLAKTDPTNRSLKARTKTFLIQTLPDEVPNATLSVTDVNPNFAKDSTKVIVPVQSVATSPDNDLVKMYEWVVIRDTNENGIFTDDKVYYKKSGATVSAIDIPVTFENSNGLFQVALTVTETFGQSTVSSMMTADSVRKTTSYATFDVNWTPDISFTMPEFAYVDDTLELNTKLKDESVGDCKVSYELLYRKSNAANTAYSKVNFTSLPAYKLTNDRITANLHNPGYYVIKATIVDAEGNKYTFTSDEIRIYDLPTAVLTQDATYQWNNTAWTYKEARKFVISGASSYADDEIGKALHEIDHNLDYWKITPKNSAITSDSILVEETNGTPVPSISKDCFEVSGNSLYQQLAILDPGQYELEYVVTNSYGKKSNPVKKTLTIREDTAPIVTLEATASQPAVNKSTGVKEAYIYLSPAVFESEDKDKILSNMYSLKYAYDSDNDGNFDEETWKTIPKSSIESTNSTTNKTTITAKLNESSLGNYKFVLWAKDTWGQETIDSVSKSEIKETKLEQIVAIENTPPNGKFTLRDVISGNVVMSSAGSILDTRIENTSKTYGQNFGNEDSAKLEVDVEEIEGGSVNLETAFDWQTDPKNPDDNNIGTIAFTSEGSAVSMKGNRSLPGKQCTYIEYKENIKQDFGFSYEIGFGDSFNAGGMLFGLSKEKVDGKDCLVGYMFSINNCNEFNTGENGTIWQICWQLETPSSNIKQGDGKTPNTMKKIQDIKLGMSDALNITIEKNAITIKGSTIEDVTVKLPDKKASGFGFFSDHYSHGCSLIGNFDMTDIELTTSNMKSLEEICLESAWESGAHKFVIYAPGDIQESMSPPSATTEDQNAYSRLISLLESQNIHLIILSSGKNHTQMTNFKNALGVESIVYQVSSLSDYDKVMPQVTQFIKNVMLDGNNSSWWRLVDDEFSYVKTYEDLNGDPQWLYEPSSNLNAFLANPSFLAQYFCYYHNANYFDNSMGVASFDGSRLNTEVTNFSKVGLYNTVYRIKDNPVPAGTDNSPDNPFDSFRKWSKDYDNDTYEDGKIDNPYQKIYVHRKPIASFSVSASRNATTGNIQNAKVTSNAYDLDHSISDKARKGLQEYEWRYATEKSGKTVTETKPFTSEAAGVNWINGKLAGITFTGSTNVRITYRVRDIDGQGFWSEPETKWIANDGTRPIAMFTTDKTFYDIGESISITDKSYSPSFTALSKWEWTVTKNSTGVSKPFTMTKASDLSNICNQIFTYIDSQQLGMTDESNTYTISLVVTDKSTLASDKYSAQICISPSNTAPTVTGNSGSIFQHNNPIIYEYDDYDDDKANTYYGNQKRGHETINWGLYITDPDDTDKYGTANDNTNFRVQFMLERYEAARRINLSSLNPVKAVTFPAKTVSAADAKVTAKVQPFSVLKDSGKELGWGSYRITAFVTDNPRNGKADITSQLVTSHNVKPLDLYVIPKLNIDDADHSFSMTFNDVEYALPTEVVPGESLKFTVQTNNRSTGVRIKYKDGSGTVKSQEMSIIRQSGNVYTWAAEWVLPEDIEEEDLPTSMLYDITIETYTNFGGKSIGGGKYEETRAKATVKQIKVLPVKLFDFKVTGVNDPSVKCNTFPVTVPNLAFDHTNAPTLTKLGYAFNFELKSKGLKKDTDAVSLVPKFYGYSDATGYTVPLDMYYINNDQYVKMDDANDTFKIATTSETDGVYLGKLSGLKLPTDVRTLSGSEQIWTGRYGIPGSAVFVPSGSLLTEDNLYTGRILVAFEIDALKNDVPKYDYVGKGQWAKEFFNASNSAINPNKAIYHNAELEGKNLIPVIVFTADDNALSNFETRPVWTNN